MRVLSVRQPWARCIAAGVKAIENRSWSTSYRGLVAIHASLRPDLAGDRDPLVLEWFGEDARVGARTGVILAVATLTGVCSAAVQDQPCGCGPWAWPDQYHWQLRNSRPLRAPVRYRGSLGLRPASTDLSTAVRDQLEDLT